MVFWNDIINGIISRLIQWVGHHRWPISVIDTTLMIFGVSTYDRSVLSPVYPFSTNSPCYFPFKESFDFSSGMLCHLPSIITQ